MGWKDVYGEDVVEVQALDEEPVEHGRTCILQQHVEALAQVRLKVEDRFQGDQISWTKKRPIFTKMPKMAPNLAFIKGFYLVLLPLETQTVSPASNEAQDLQKVTKFY